LQIIEIDAADAACDWPGSYEMDDRILGQMIACATMTDSPLNVVLGEPYSR
jgi:hypothetical protein